ncbi:MBL fold metallo-hydrolase [Herminiimonas fonticola]|uniref:Glyoxylase-like metal-dependent hydrolase (Beta-lactamase superfamily II) n=1 Tax=Herminiimonas fonticola TaxID=303380 RepID=A0A4R6GII2_9BURK|nr:MBL fold metallo-hydrolase [Herminiimonas fonticola]RBA25674.1 Metallo-beta-lactamase superfamily [Herminiimonas fonticola]TDN94782.1 glyoxylase-like metal-dependent hydrolase (beta-lactamase superfamily II) [Herminiimonas fonticola]
MNILRFRTPIIGTITVVFSLLIQATAFAAAPLVKTQAPGYYRMMLGDYEVTALSDGTAVLPVHELLHESPEKTKKALHKSFLNSPTETSFNSFLINTGEKLILIDTGAGALFGPTLGNLAANLKAAGYQLDQVDEIYITHMHPDHIGGLGTSTSVFPNAIVRADRRDADYWLSKANMEKAPAKQKDFFKGAISTIGQYADAGKLKTFDGNTQLQTGIRAVSNYGHTPGHTTYVVESKGQKLVLLGDLVHVAAVQFDNPAVTIAFDSDAKAAEARRKAVFAEATKQGYLIGAAHLQFPGLGHIRAKGKAYEFVPTNYSIPR